MEKIVNATRRSKPKIGIFKWCLGRTSREEGNTLVEMALICAFVYLPMLFGIFEVSYAVYVYNFVCSVSHQATRYAAVRGFNSCTIASTFIDCDINPTGSSNTTPATTSGTQTLQQYVQNMRYPAIYANNLAVTATWYTETFNNSSGFSVGSWTTPCTTADNTASPCNIPGYAVEVRVIYSFPLNIPFWGKQTIPITSTSKMMINE